MAIELFVPLGGVPNRRDEKRDHFDRLRGGLRPIDDDEWELHYGPPFTSGTS
jgi:hypothetical protein